MEVVFFSPFKGHLAVSADVIGYHHLGEGCWWHHMMGGKHSAASVIVLLSFLQTEMTTASLGDTCGTTMVYVID